MPADSVQAPPKRYRPGRNTPSGWSRWNQRNLERGLCRDCGAKRGKAGRGVFCRTCAGKRDATDRKRRAARLKARLCPGCGALVSEMIFKRGVRCTYCAACRSSRAKRRAKAKKQARERREALQE